MVFVLELRARFPGRGSDCLCRLGQLLQDGQETRMRVRRTPSAGEIQSFPLLLSASLLPEAVGRGMVAKIRLHS